MDLYMLYTHHVAAGDDAHHVYYVPNEQWGNDIGERMAEEHAKEQFTEFTYVVCPVEDVPANLR